VEVVARIPRVPGLERIAEGRHETDSGEAVAALS
jgi:hypothetical protein